MKAHRRVSEVSKLLKPQGQSNHIATQFQSPTTELKRLSPTNCDVSKHRNHIPIRNHDINFNGNGNSSTWSFDHSQTLSRTQPMVTTVPIDRSAKTLLRDALPLVAIWVPKRFNRLILHRANLIPTLRYSPRESTTETIHESSDSPSCPGGSYELPDISVLSGGYEGTKELPFNKTACNRLNP